MFFAWLLAAAAVLPMENGLSSTELATLHGLDENQILTNAAKCIADSIATGAELTGSLTRYCAAKDGVYDSLLLPVAITDNDLQSASNALGEFVDREAHARECTHYGAWVRNDTDTRIAVVLFTHRIGELYLDNPPARGKYLIFHGGLGLDYEAPHALLTLPDGSVKDVRLIVVGKREFAGQLKMPPETGRYQLEIIGWSHALGPAVVANRALFVGVEPEPPPVIAKTDEDPRARLLALMNDAREKNGEAPLAPDPTLQQVAQAHASDMFERGYFGHDSPEDNVVMRLRDAHVNAPVLAENLAEAVSPEDVHATLMSSPGHRKNVLDARLQKVGIGVVQTILETGDPCLIVVVDFAGQGT